MSDKRQPSDEDAVRNAPARPSLPARKSYLNKLQQMLADMGASEELLGSLAERRKTREAGGSSSPDELDQ